MNYDIVINTLEFCKKRYSEKTFIHCVRVAGYARNNICLRDDNERTIAMTMALCHDLLEDTDATIDEICDVTQLSKSFVAEVLTALTRNGNESYDEYIQRLKCCRNMYPYIIKLADMKDHLMQKSTLTDRLKEKYWNALPELL